MNDRYQTLARSPIGRLVVQSLGLPDPPVLERYTAGAPLVQGAVLVSMAPGGRLGRTVSDLLAGYDIATTTDAVAADSYKGVVLDATGIESPTDLGLLQELLTPVLRTIAPNGRVVVIGTPPERATDDGRAIAQRALEGLTRSLGKELGRGSTVQLVYVAEGAEEAVGSTLAFLLSPKSAYVSGQVVRIGTTEFAAVDQVPDLRHPLQGRVALVTGASRGLGRAMARTLHRDGATIVGLDVPALAADLSTAMGEVDGASLVLDITAEDAPRRIADTLAADHGGVDVVVHNAGITRDKRLRNMTRDTWDRVIEVNLGAPRRITAELLDRQLIHRHGRVIGVSSIAGIAGNDGQTNYATSKAGVIGFVDELSSRIASRAITVNAVAPGFIETDMVKTIPFAVREAGRRMNSMRQGGRPIDVAEAVAWLADPGSYAVSGNVVRVCGQSLLGA